MASSAALAAAETMDTAAAGGMIMGSLDDSVLDDRNFSRILDGGDFDLDKLISRERANLLKQQVQDSGYLNVEDDSRMQTLEAALGGDDDAVSSSYLNVRPAGPEGAGGGNDAYLDFDGRPLPRAGGYLSFDEATDGSAKARGGGYLELGAGRTGKDSGAYLDVSALCRSFNDVALGREDGSYCNIVPAAPTGGSQASDYLTTAQVDTLEKMLAALMQGRGHDGPVAATELDSLAFRFTRHLERLSTKVENLSLDELLELAGPDAFKAWVHKEATLFRVSGRHNHAAAQLLGTIRDKMVRAVLEQQRQRGLALRLAPKDAAKLRYLDTHVLRALEDHYRTHCGNKILERGTFLVLGDRSAYIESAGRPDFARFDDICNRLFEHISRATAELLKGVRLSHGATFYISGKIVKGLEKALLALGAAGDIELCPDGIRKAHLEGMGNIIWKLGRVFGMRTVQDDKALLDRTADLIAALNRLGFLLDRVLHDRPALVNMDLLHRNFRSE